MSTYTHVAPASTYIRVCRRPHRYVYSLYLNQVAVFHTESKLRSGECKWPKSKEIELISFYTYQLLHEFNSNDFSSCASTQARGT